MPDILIRFRDENDNFLDHGVFMFLYKVRNKSVIPLFTKENAIYIGSVKMFPSDEQDKVN